MRRSSYLLPQSLIKSGNHDNHMVKDDWTFHIICATASSGVCVFELKKVSWIEKHHLSRLMYTMISVAHGVMSVF